MNSWLVPRRDLRMSCSMTDTLSWAIHFLSGTVCANPRYGGYDHNKAAACAPPPPPPPPHLCWRPRYTTWGHFTSAIRRKKPPRLFCSGRLAYALCSESVHLTAWLEWSCSVWRIRRGKNISTAWKTKGLAAGKSALCLVQFKSKDNQECLFDNSIYNALFWSPEPPKQRQIGFKQVI